MEFDLRPSHGQPGPVLLGESTFKTRWDVLTLSQHPPPHAAEVVDCKVKVTVAE